MNIAVCEDNADDAGIICGYLQEHLDKNGFIGDIHTFTSGEAMLAACSSGLLFDAVFLDIYMGGMTGIETAQKMRDTDPGFALIYITSSDDYARQAYSLRACAYVSKPVQADEMNLAFAQCREVFLKSARFIKILSERQSIRIPLVKILYVEVFNRDAVFHLTTGIVKTALPLDEIEHELGSPFLRCHRSYLINMNFVDRLCEQDILMKNGDAIPMRRRGRSEIRGTYGDFLTNRLFEVI